jgi:hypothetical protein
MANHCWNWAVFNGTKDALDKLESALKLAQKDIVYFDKQCEYVLGKSYLGENQSIYDVYGTRWFDINNFERNSDTELVISGDSAWSPPCEYVRLITEHYEIEATIEYEEMGNDFGGRETYDNGKTIHTESMSYREWMYKEDSDSAVDRLMMDIDDDPELYEELDDLMDDISHMSEEHKEEIIKHWKDVQSNS